MIDAICSDCRSTFQALQDEKYVDEEVRCFKCQIAYIDFKRTLDFNNSNSQLKIKYCADCKYSPTSKYFLTLNTYARQCDRCTLHQEYETGRARFEKSQSDTFATCERYDLASCSGTMTSCSLCRGKFCSTHLAHRHMELSNNNSTSFRKCDKCHLPATSYGRCSYHGFRGTMYNSQGSLLYDGR